MPLQEFYKPSQDLLQSNKSCFSTGTRQKTVNLAVLCYNYYPITLFTGSQSSSFLSLLIRDSFSLLLWYFVFSISISCFQTLAPLIHFFAVAHCILLILVCDRCVFPAWWPPALSTAPGQDSPHGAFPFHFHFLPEKGYTFHIGCLVGGKVISLLLINFDLLASVSFFADIFPLGTRFLLWYTNDMISLQISF